MPSPSVSTRSGRRIPRIGAAGVAAALLAAGLVDAHPAAADVAEGDLIADLSFDDADTGLTGAGAKATVNGTLSLAPGSDGTNAVSLSSANWLTLTKDDGSPLLAGLNDVTISYDSNPAASGNTGWAFFAAPSTATQTYQNEHYVGTLDRATSLVVERYNNSGTRVSTGNLTASSTVSGWKHVDIVISGANAQLYVDGQQRATNSAGVPLSTIVGSGGGIVQLGKANWTAGGEYFTGQLDNLKIYDTALTQTQVETNAVDTVAAQLPDTLTIEASSYLLPGAAGVVTWTSQTDAVVIGSDGRTAAVTRPEAGSDPVTGTLTATVTLGSTSVTKQVAVTITAPPTAEQSARADLDAITIPGLSDVRSSLALPLVGAVYDEAISWTSSDPGVISDTADGDVAAGVVERGPSDQTVTLTATIGDFSRSFAAHVRAAAPAVDPTSYLFAHFTGTEGSVSAEQIYFATSDDGATWTDTRANGAPVLSSVIGDKGVRDPYLVRSPEGDHFYLIATDLSIYYRGGWGSSAATTTGSLKLVVWESDDLAHWTEPRLVDVASKIPGAGMAWAPEAFWDEVKQQYVVYWATGSDTANTLGDRTNVWYATTRDFETFSDPVKWIDRTGSIIDTTMIKVGDWYYRASGDGQITIEKSKNLYAVTTAATAPAYVDDQHWSLVGTLSSIFGNSNYSGAKLEGPEFFEYNSDDWPTGVPTWGLMADQYSAGTGYLPFRTTDIASTTPASSGGGWSTAPDINFGSLKKRHGTILPITAEELAAVQDAAVGTTGDLGTVTGANTDELAGIVAAVAGLGSAGYTPSTWAAFESALAAANAVLADPLASQEAADTALGELQAAASALTELGEIIPGTPVISGAPKVGATLSVDPGTWAPATVDLSYQWSRNGSSISAATDATYQIRPADLGASITVTVTGSQTDHATESVTSAATAAVAKGTLQGTRPTVKGTPEVGRKLTAKVGAWSPSGVKLTYRWFRNGKAIPASARATHTVTRKDKGKRITVRVTGSKPGYTSLTTVSRPTRKVR